jgi:peptide/nickel transport system ATP-binding protein
MSLLEVRNLTLGIAGSPILNGVSFDIAEGEIFALVGESGSGKSMSALSVIQLLPDGTTLSGTVHFNELELSNQPEAAMCAARGRDIGMVFQEPMTALNPVKTIGDQVAETLLIHGISTRSEALAIARERLNRVGLGAERFPLDRYPHELSGGQRQRVCIAMAIALRPKLLIADEPTTALDVTTQAEILDLLGDLVRDEGMALMLITHDLAVVSGIADRVAVMKDGEIVETGDTKGLFRQRHHPYTQALIEASGHTPDRKATATESPLLEVAGLVRDYPLPRVHVFGPRPTFRAVDDVSFALNAGESLGLVGESGCGKSTLTRAILGLDPVQSGKVVLDDDLVTAPHVPRNVRQKMQVVFQDPFGSFNPRHKVDRLVAEPFHLTDLSPDERQDRIADVLKAVGLNPGDMNRYIHEFSGGQRQRIAIARAIVIRPKLVILDEAVSALDVSIRSQILDLLAELQAQFGLSYLFISHDLSVVRRVTDRVLVMQRGKIVEAGPTEQVFQAPSHGYTQALIAATPVLQIETTAAE